MFTNQIVESVFQKNNISEFSVEELSQLNNQFPFFATTHFLLAKKLKETESNAFENQLQKTSLFFQNTEWLHFLLSTKTETQVETKTSTPFIKIAEQEINESDLIFEPYHSIDYFASQGIKYQPENKPTDRFSQQLKSFTGWLKSLKENPIQNIPQATESESEKNVIQLAGQSIFNSNVTTEAMAEVWIKQNDPEKAIAVYKKLSLLDPAKSTYFANLIDNLKRN